MYYSGKETDNVIIIATNILLEINYQKPYHSSDLHKLAIQYINYQITIAHSTPIITVEKSILLLLSVFT